MRKITLSQMGSYFGVSAMVGALVTGITIYVTSPDAQAAPVLPVVNFKNIEVDDSIIDSRAVPFRSAAKALLLKNNPKSPKVPAQPDADPTERLAVVGVLPPDVVVLQKNGEVITARVGTKCKFGYISSVSFDGACVGGRFLEYKR